MASSGSKNRGVAKWRLAKKWRLAHFSLVATVEGFGAGLGVQGPITSPTFTLVWVHESGRLPFAHADFYRLGDGSELQELGLDELLEGDGVAVIEWADRFKEALPADRLSGSLAHAGPDTRTLELIATGPRSRAWLQALD